MDAAELELALINIALNAQHAMPGGGMLRIDARNESPSMVVLAVQDNGNGIAPEVLARAFEPFFTTKAAGTGSGLGLTQVNGLCTQAGGRASIDSAPGKGTCVSLHFPSAARAGDSAIEAPPAPRLLQGSVLLVEDNDDVASATETLLYNAGLQVLRVHDADQALRQLAGTGPLPDLVLSDIAMPGQLDGIGLAFALRETWPTLPVLLTTGYAERIDEAVLGGFQVLAKPAPPEQMLATVAALLERAVAAAAARTR